MFRFITVIPAAALILTVGCLSSTTQEKDVLISKNKVYEKQNLLLERENSVLKTESAQALEALHAAEAHGEKIESDKRALQKKYDEDTSLLRTKITALETEHAVFKKESAEKTAALIEQNRLTEKKLAAEIQRLSGEMKSLAENFNAERENLKKEFAHKESASVEKINMLSDTLRDRDRKIESLEAAAAALTAKQNGRQPEQQAGPSKGTGAPKADAGKDNGRNAQ